MKIEIELTDQEAARARAALGNLHQLTSRVPIAMRDVVRDGKVVDRIQDYEVTLRPATDDELREYLLKQLRGTVRNYETRTAAASVANQPFAGS